MRKLCEVTHDSSGRQVADQIGHSQVSLAQNAYMARKVANPQAAQDLEQFLRHSEKDG